MAHATTQLSKPSRLSAMGWLAVPLCALGFLVWINTLRVRHVEYVAAIGELSGSSPGVAPSAPAEWQPRLIVPEHLNRSYEWLDLTRQMFDRREWRVRHIDYENAPYGRDVYATSPYRWWLGLVAWCDHAVSSRSLDRSVERAALIADPLLHLLLFAGTVVFVAWQFGALPAALLSFGLATLFPFAAEFLPGVPGDHGLTQVLALWSVLPLFAGIGALNSKTANAKNRARRWFFIAGVVGGLGLWISVAHQVPVLVGVIVGALMAAGIARGAASGKLVETADLAPWREWALGGAMTVLGAYVIEYFPLHLASWELQVIHPLYGLAWLGAGELLARAATWIQRRKPDWSLRGLGVIIFSLAAATALPVVMWRTHNEGFLDPSPALFRLTRLPGGAVATSLWNWMIHDGITPAFGVTVLPVLLLGPAAWLLLRSETNQVSRLRIAIGFGPAVIALGFACHQLSWWNGLDTVLLGLLVAATTVTRGAVTSRIALWGWSSFAALAFLPGAIHVIPSSTVDLKVPTEAEVFGLIERDLARWMATHVDAGSAVILAPHNQATTLHYYGGLRGLATLGWENRDGLSAAIRITSSSTPEEAKELIYRRGITHIVIPSWDPYLDIYTQMGMGRIEGTFMNLIHLWKLPPWLRPVAYQLPTISGFEGQSVTILEVVDDQEDVVALSRLAEYFVEMGQMNLATSLGQGLRRFPADVGAIVARAQVEIARGDTEASTRLVELLQTRLAGKGDRNLPWDRRVSLAIVLAQAKHMDLARTPVQQCLAEIDEAKLRSLSTGALYRLQVLGKAFGLTIADPHLHQLALDLVPVDMQARLREP